jgi:hypothetical protein
MSHVTSRRQPGDPLLKRRPSQPRFLADSDIGKDRSPRGRDHVAVPPDMALAKGYSRALWGYGQIPTARAHRFVFVTGAETVLNSPRIILREKKAEDGDASICV